MITTSSLRPTRRSRALALTMAVVVAWDVLVTLAYLNLPGWFGLGEFPFPLFGSAIALFIGFAVNAAYQRWWEARTLWGAIVNNSRSLARQAITMIDDAEAARHLVRAQIAYVHALRTSLRGQTLAPEAESFADVADRREVTEAVNAPASLLLEASRTLSVAQRAGDLGEMSRVQIESTLSALTDAQGGLERIKNTPLPVHYRVLPGFFARLFCAVLPFAVVHDLGVATPVGSALISLMFLVAVQAAGDLADPFTDGVHDVPMTALCRTVEIDLRQMLQEEAPPKVAPVGNVLW